MGVFANRHTAIHRWLPSEISSRASVYVIGASDFTWKVSAAPLHRESQRRPPERGKAPILSNAYKVVRSPVGNLKLVASDKGLVAILWENENPKRVRLGEPVLNYDHPVLLDTERQLNEYFQGKRKSFSLKLDLIGTRFQSRVWQALLGIPFGETRSYGQLARELGNPRASRAVGAATGRNPISIVVPCHRLIGASGKLTGFAGGLETKAHLLRLESESQ